MSTTRSSADLNQSNENTALIVRTTQPTYGSATAEPNQASTTSAEEITEEENDNIIEINTADYAHVTEEEEDNFTWDWVWIALAACRTGANALEPLLAYFLYQAIVSISNTLTEEFGADQIPWLLVMINVITIFLVTTHTLNNMSSVNVTEDAEIAHEEIRSHRELTGHSLAAHRLAIASRILSLPSMGLSAAANAVAIAYLSDNPAVRWVVGTGTTALGLAALALFETDVNKHSEALINRLINSKKALINIVKSPLLSLEVCIEALSNITYRAISAGYITQQLLKKLLGLTGNHAAILPLIATAAALTSYNTAFSHILPIQQAYFNEEWRTLRENIVRQTRVTIRDWITNALFALTRGAGTAWFCYRFTPGPIALKISLAAASGLAASLHNFYALMVKCRYEIAFQQYQQRQRVERLAILDENTTAAKLFNQLAREYQTPSLNRTVLAMNMGASTAKWLAFVGFLLSLQQALMEQGITVPLNLYDTLFLALGWGTATIFADKAAYERSTRDVWTYWRAKYHIGAPNQAIAQQCLPSRIVQTLFYPKKHYPLLTLQRAEQAHEEQDLHRFQMEPLLPQPAP